MRGLRLTERDEAERPRSVGLEDLSGCARSRRFLERDEQVEKLRQREITSQNPAAEAAATVDLELELPSQSRQKPRLGGIERACVYQVAV